MSLLVSIHDVTPALEAGVCRDLPDTLDRWLSRHSPISYAAMRDT
jgi:hypothetical protein